MSQMSVNIGLNLLQQQVLKLINCYNLEILNNYVLISVSGLPRWSQALLLSKGSWVRFPGRTKGFHQGFLSNSHGVTFRGLQA